MGSSRSGAGTTGACAPYDPGTDREAALVERSIKVFGAGSIGNHLAHAARRLGWSVHLCDVDPAALKRTRNEIYPGRYGQWDDAIVLSTVDDAPRGGFDLIVVGTPPDVHVDVALEAVAESPQAILVEKPVCGPDLGGAQTLADACQRSGVRGFVGYDHVVGRSMAHVGEVLAGGNLGEVLTIDVEFREHWGGMLRAHPWLTGPESSYLGHWRRGGGASGEHSHATNLWQHLARDVGAGEVVAVDATLRYATEGGAEYDDLYLVGLRTEEGLVGRVAQDVVTQPVRKWLRVQGSSGAIEWTASAPQDRIDELPPEGPGTSYSFDKTRPDDFVAELTHIDRVLDSGTPSPIDLERGLDTMLVLSAAHLSQYTRRSVQIDRSKGYRPEALQALT